MKILDCALVILNLQVAFSFKVIALDYVLQTIEYLANEYSGVFSCVFYDISRREPYNNILNEVLKSPRLSHIVKYVLNGSFHDDLWDRMPFHPTMLLVYPGNEVGHLGRTETIYNMTYTLSLFDPATNVLVLVDSNRRVAKEMEDTLYWINYASSAILFTNTMRVTICNGVYCLDQARVLHPRDLFTLLRRQITGRNLTYIVNEAVMPFYWNHKWINETARYLHTEAVEYPVECSGSGVGYEKCMEKYRLNFEVAADILFVNAMVTKTRSFRELYTGIPWFVKITVPRDRPYNAIELMLMPFTCHAWILLVLILVASEVVKRLFPELLKNDPILLVVCGFERHNLHRASLCEKIIILSLIALMFFMSSAFETKIISLMIKTPSVHKIKTLDDIVSSAVNFYGDMERIPDLSLNPVIGKLLIQGEKQKLYEIVPDTVLMMNSDWMEMLDELAFDFERMQPFYVVLDDEFFGGNEMYIMKHRCIFLEVFRTIHSRLVESGLMEYWKQQWKDGQVEVFSGRRMKMKIKDKTDLNFNDMQPAWMSLVIGCCASLIGFFGELLGNRFYDWFCNKRTTFY